MDCFERNNQTQCIFHSFSLPLGLYWSFLEYSTAQMFRFYLHITLSEKCGSMQMGEKKIHTFKLPQSNIEIYKCKWVSHTHTDAHTNTNKPRLINANNVKQFREYGNLVGTKRIQINGNIKSGINLKIQHVTHMMCANMNSLETTILTYDSLKDIWLDQMSMRLKCLKLHLVAVLWLVSNRNPHSMCSVCKRNYSCLNGIR